MISGTPAAARWMCAAPRRTLPAGAAERMVRTAIPQGRMLDLQPLTDGLRNANFKLRVSSDPGWLVLRIYEHDPSLCQKEMDLIRLVKDSIPVPEVLHAEPNGCEDIPPFALMRFVEGISFRDLARSRDAHSIAQAAHSVGQALDSLGRITFAKAGWVGPGPSVQSPLLEGPDPLPRFVDLCLDSPVLHNHMPDELRRRTHELVWSWAGRLACVADEHCLVHGDFGKRNVLVREVDGSWTVAAVLDWEFAVSSSPLVDVGHFLRYERTKRAVVEPHFSAGFAQAGGKLPDDWRRLARVLDAAALVESLTHDDLPHDVAAELVELILATVEDRDPQLE